MLDVLRLELSALRRAGFDPGGRNATARGRYGQVACRGWCCIALPGIDDRLWLCFRCHKCVS
jgi:hypothetical protein